MTVSPDAEPEQPPLFPDAGGDPDEKSGRVVESRARSILTRATGFMSDYDFTLNPYAGCAFGCTYCYAAFFARDQVKQDTWGAWVEAKSNAVALLRRMRTPLEGRSVYMSSVTDPYQPVEKRLGLTRAVLEELIAHQPRLVIQTRSPLVTRDIDLFERFARLRVNLTVTTDSEDVRRAFEPQCPPNEARLDAAERLVGAGIDVGITMTPLLPVDDPEAFAERLRATGVERFVVQGMHVASGRFIAGTRERALAVSEAHGWGDEAYRVTLDRLKAVLPGLQIGRDGFGPP